MLAGRHLRRPLQYTANAGSANVSQYATDADGALSLVGDGANGATDSGPVDLDVSDGDGPCTC